MLYGRNLAIYPIPTVRVEASLGFFKKSIVNKGRRFFAFLSFFIYASIPYTQYHHLNLTQVSQKSLISNPLDRDRHQWGEGVLFRISIVAIVIIPCISTDPQFLLESKLLAQLSLIPIFVCKIAKWNQLGHFHTKPSTSHHQNSDPNIFYFLCIQMLIKKKRNPLLVPANFIIWS